jgi:hypothetical protein
MKKILSCALVMLSMTSFSQTAQRKVLFIGIDGCRWDAIDAANTPSIDNLLTNSIYSENGLTEYKTWSGTGWSNMLTGVWHTKHGVSDNSFSGSNYTQYPDFISRVENFDANLSTYSVVQWAPINTKIIQSIDNEITVATDLLVKNSAVNILTNAYPDVLFVAFDDVDHAGHSYGFSASISEYIEAIETTDSYISEIITALQSRPNYSNEDWLIVVTTDHGGIPAGHGGGTLEERTIFNIYSNPNFTAQNLTRDTLTNISTFDEVHFNAATYAQPVDQTPFLFGASQDFTIEFWVNAIAYTNDPAFVSNKDWNNGISAGFVISANQGQYWKVNIGDGANRLDIQGGFIQPNQWHHIAVSFERNGLMTAYEDGVVVGFESMQNIGNINSGLPLTINQDGTTTYAYNFDGNMKDIRIWNTTIPDSIIVQWATIPVTASHPYYTNLLANWKCEDGSGSVLQDASINTNNCNVTGPINWNLNQTDTFMVYDYSATTREPDNAVTAIDWLCIPIQPIWNLDGKSWVANCATTLVEQVQEPTNFEIHPNPTTNQITIQFKDQHSQNNNVSLFDYTGKLLMHITIPPDRVDFQISLADFCSGIYFLQISNANGATAAKIIKM